MTTQLTNRRAPAHADVFDLYLEGLRELPAPLTREAEVRAAERIEAAERACLDHILERGVPLPELAQWAARLADGDLEILELAQLGLYDGADGRKRLIGDLAKAAELERRRERARTPVTKRRALSARNAAVRALGLHRERIQGIVARVLAELERRPALARDLAVAKRELDAARNHLAEANLRLVIMLAKPYRKSGVAFGDLVQEGNLGLMRAIDKYDHRVGTRFSTYAAWWIRQSIAREITRHRDLVRLPFGLVDKRRRAHRTAHELSTALGRPADATEVASHLGVTTDQVRRSLEAGVHSVSLSATVGDDGDRPYEEVLGDESSLAIDESVIAEQRYERARAILSELAPREQLILRRRFGFDGDDDVTLREIGEELGLSRERVRQLEATALEKLRRAFPDGF